MENINQNNTFSALYFDSKYEKPSVTVDAVIFRLVNKETKNYRKLPEKKLQIFLSKRNYPPFKDFYGIIGTFIDLNNELSNSMQLCVKNKVGLKNFYYEQLFTFGENTRDPRARVLSVAYLLLTSENYSLYNGEWFDVDISSSIEQQVYTENGHVLSQVTNIVLSNDNLILDNTLQVTQNKENLRETKNIDILHSSLAFDHIKIVYFALERLKNKLEYTDIIFNLLPKKFTLTELKHSYEVILNEKLLDANFRRKTSKMVQPTNEYITGRGHRSSQIFVHNPSWTINNLD